MKDYNQLLKRQKLLRNVKLPIWKKQSKGHFKLKTKLMYSDNTIMQWVCSSSATA